MELKERINNLNEDFQKHIKYKSLEEFIVYILKEKEVLIFDLAFLLCKEKMFRNFSEAYNYLAPYYNLSKDDVTNMKFSDRHFDGDMEMG